jgi:diguanylate cyclase (GGDEF)-like protein/PAS domain S-box-containing protein
MRGLSIIDLPSIRLVPGIGMTLRKRLWQFSLPLLGLTLLCVYLLSHYFLAETFERQDGEELVVEVTQLAALFDFETARHLKVVSRYAGRGEAREFVASSADGGLNDLDNLDLDFVLYLDASGRVVNQHWRSQAPDEFPSLIGRPPASLGELQASVVRRVLELGSLDHHGDPGHRFGRLVVVDGVPMLLVSAVVSDERKAQPPNGAIVAGRLMDERVLTQLRLLMRADVELLVPTADGMHWQGLRERGELSDSTHIGEREILGNKQRIQLLYSTPAGQPDFRIALTLPRTSFLSGMQAFEFFLVTVLAVCVLNYLLTLYGLDRGILRRIQRMHAEVAGIGGPEAVLRLTDQGADELGSLSREMNAMLERLDQSEARDRMILDSIQDGYFELDMQGLLQRVNPAFCQIFGLSMSELVGSSYSRLIDPADVARATGALEIALHGQSSFSAPLTRPDGTTIHFEARFAAVRTAEGELLGYRGIIRDTSEQVSYQNQLLDLAYRDPLTGLGNRKAFGEHLKGGLDSAGRREQALGLLYIDLDRFKEVNDRFGHDIGDDLLLAIAERIRGILRQPDRFYRLGGDEFTILLQDSGQESAQRLAERILVALQQPFEIRHVRIDFVTPSIGIAVFPDHAVTPESLIKAADSAMYQAKHKRNQVSLYQSG